MACSEPAFYKLAYNTHEPHGGVDGNLAPIIFLHGVTFSKEQWVDIPQVVANATKRRAYALDARNHGDSVWSDHWSFDVNSNDLIHFLEVHGLQKSILVGHSMGGVTAIHTALKRPDLVERIIIEDIGVRRLSKEILKSIHVYISLCRKAIDLVPEEVQDEDEVKTFILKYVASNFPQDMVPLRKADSFEDVRQNIVLEQIANRRYAFKANLEVMKRCFAHPETIMTDVHGVNKEPALFIYGKLSPALVGADEHHIKQFFPNAIFKGIEDAAHLIHSDKPLEFTDALIQFLS